MTRFRTAAVALLVGAAWTLAVATPASAHTGFESSDPADGAAVDIPVEQITINFTGPAEPTGDGFVALDASGELRAPSESTSAADGATWVLRFDPPLGGGEIGLRWNVKAPDAHPIDGAFSFTAPAPAAAEAPGAATATSTLATAGDTNVANPADTTLPAAATSDSEASGGATSNSDLEDFLDPATDSIVAAERLGDVARLISVMGTILGIGALVFAVAVLQPGGAPASDSALALTWARRSGLALVLGAALKVLSRANLEAAGSWGDTFNATTVGDALSGAIGVSIALQAAGGLALALGARASLSAPRPESSSAPRRPSDARLAMVGAALVLASRLFAGHTVTEGNRVVTAMVDLVHTAAGAVWAGGVVLLVAVLWRRFQEDRDMGTGPLALRFSVVASAAVVVVALAGVALSVIILDAPSELWTTPWGRLLTVKVALVGAAAIIGAYNHRVLIPRMEANPGDDGPAGSFRMMIAAEALALLGTGVVTAFLVGASSA